jgi:hypothetical protein
MPGVKRGSGWRGSRGYSNRGTGRSGGFSGRGERGERGGRGRARKWQEQPKPDLLKHPLGELLTTIANTDLEEEGGTETAATVTGCKYVSSYNWLNETTPTILVPGTHLEPPCLTQTNPRRKTATVDSAEAAPTVEGRPGGLLSGSKRCEIPIVSYAARGASYPSS